MHKEHIWTLLARKFTGEASAIELQELEQLLEKDEPLQLAAERMLEYWQNASNSDVQLAISSFARLDERVQRGEQVGGNEPAPVYEISAPSRTKKLRIALAAAASVIAIISIGWYMLTLGGSHKPEPLALQEISTPGKSIRIIKLPDGSTTWLNENSKLEYGKMFDKKTREVWLSGEAFFDIAHNKEKPFIIHAHSVNIKVLGTAFNIKSYPGDKTVETSLVRGSVEISREGDPSRSYILKPYQKLVVDITAPMKDSTTGTASEKYSARYEALARIPDKADSVIPEISWKDHKLAFYEMTFSDLAGKLENRFDVSFKFENKSKKELVFTGVFYQQSLTEILRALSLTAPFNYYIKDQTVYIK